MNLQPIETAPRDQTTVLLHCPDDDCIIVEGWFSPKHGRWLQADSTLREIELEGDEILFNPTHWAEAFDAPPLSA